MYVLKEMLDVMGYRVYEIQTRLELEQNSGKEQRDETDSKLEANIVALATGNAPSYPPPPPITSILP
jgi:hypothetical protein